VKVEETKGRLIINNYGIKGEEEKQDFPNHLIFVDYRQDLKMKK